MMIPEGLDEQKVIDTIMKIAKRLAPKYVFTGYDAEDIEQEAFLIGVSGLDKYDPSRPLENFMYTHINNRLKTFKRNNYYRMDYGSSAQKLQDRKRSLLEPISIDNIYNICTQDHIVSDAHLSEILDLIDRKLPADLRRDYLKLQSNSSLPKNRRAIIIEAIEKIINGEEV
jgi:DNA-directed RNA polymerase specialized sigma24 family protein